MTPKALPKYEPPKRVVIKHKDNSYTLKCGEIPGGGMELRAKDADLMAELATGVMQECHRLRWIITQLDERIGGHFVMDVTEATQTDYEIIRCNDDPATAATNANGGEK